MDRVTVLQLSTNRRQAPQTTRLPAGVLGFVLRRFRTQVVARSNARAAAQAMAAGRREREEVEAFLDAHLGERAAPRVPQQVRR